MITRRGLLAAAGSLLAPAGIISGHAEVVVPNTKSPKWERVDPKEINGAEVGTFPGDYGCGHLPYHPFYARVFGQIGHCACGDGECRVTDWRSTQLGSPIGYDVIVLRQWCALPEDVWQPKPHQIPKELRNERAHVCAYGIIGYTTIPCVIINESKS